LKRFLSKIWRAGQRDQGWLDAIEKEDIGGGDGSERVI
jgi:hypothetical protein